MERSLLLRLIATSVLSILVNVGYTASVDLDCITQQCLESIPRGVKYQRIEITGSSNKFSFIGLKGFYPNQPIGNGVANVEVDLSSKLPLLSVQLGTYNYSNLIQPPYIDSYLDLKWYNDYQNSIIMNYFGNGAYVKSKAEYYGDNKLPWNKQLLYGEGGLSSTTYNSTEGYVPPIWVEYDVSNPDPNFRHYPIKNSFKFGYPSPVGFFMNGTSEICKQKFPNCNVVTGQSKSPENSTLHYYGLQCKKGMISKIYGWKPPRGINIISL